MATTYNAQIAVKYTKEASQNNTTNYIAEYPKIVNDTVTYTKEIVGPNAQPIKSEYKPPIITPVITNNTSPVMTYVPDVTTWTNLGTSPFCGAPIINSGDTLYCIGGRISGSKSSKIYTISASNPIIWTDTGKTLPISDLLAPRIVRIKDTYYIFGDQNGSNAMLSAPYSDPTTWTSIGTFPYPRLEADIIIFKDRIILSPGYNGLNNFVYANVNTPTVWNIGLSGMDNIYEGCMIPINDNYFRLIGGVNNNYTKTYDYNFNLISSIANETTYRCTPSVWEIEKNKYIGFGFCSSATATTDIRYLSNNDSESRRSTTTSLPVSFFYSYGCEFIDNNGYLYLINNTTPATIMRSGRKLSQNPSNSIKSIRKSWLTYLE